MSLLHESRARAAAGAAFAVMLSLWTWKLLEPNPVPEQFRELIGFWDWLPYLLAKSLHLCVYGFLAATGWVAAPQALRPWLVAFMLSHGVATEIGQTYVPNRSGNVKDVFIDATGTTLGVLLARRLTRHAPPNGSLDDPAEPAADAR